METHLAINIFINFIEINVDSVCRTCVEEHTQDAYVILLILIKYFSKKML